MGQGSGRHLVSRTVSCCRTLRSRSDTAEPGAALSALKRPSQNQTCRHPFRGAERVAIPSPEMPVPQFLLPVHVSPATHNPNARGWGWAVLADTGGRRGARRWTWCSSFGKLALALRLALGTIARVTRARSRKCPCTHVSEGNPR